MTFAWSDQGGELQLPPPVMQSPPPKKTTVGLFGSKEALSSRSTLPAATGMTTTSTEAGKLSTWPSLTTNSNLQRWGRAVRVKPLMVGLAVSALVTTRAGPETCRQE